jgi:hypothetical protein
MIATARILVLAGITLLALASTGRTFAQSGAPLARADRSTPPPTKEAPGKERDARAERGIVQSVSRTAIVLKELDGSTLTIRVDAKTRVFLDGKRASLLDVHPGFVAVVKRERNRAREIRAFDPSKSEDASASTSRKDHAGRK